MSFPEEKIVYVPPGTISITFGERAENHKGMQLIGGDLANEGFSVRDLENMYLLFEMLGVESKIYDLNSLLEGEEKGQHAAVLVIKNGVNELLKLETNPENSKDHTELFKDLAELRWDTKAFMYGRVVNKKARYNLCFAKHGQEPDYKNKKGCIVKFNDVPLLKRIWSLLSVYFGDKAKDMQCEGNYYYNAKKCFIGYHGDSERKKVISLRLGEEIPLCYQWYKGGNPVGNKFMIEIKGGDMYVMSEKATGWDWKRRSQLTLRHAAGRKFR